MQTVDFYLYPHKSVNGFLGLVTDVFTVHKIEVLYVLGIKNINVYQHTYGSVHKQRLLPWNMMHDPCFLAAVHYGVQKWYMHDPNQPNLSQPQVACMKLPTYILTVFCCAKLGIAKHEWQNETLRRAESILMRYSLFSVFPSDI